MNCKTGKSNEYRLQTTNIIFSKILNAKKKHESTNHMSPQQEKNKLFLLPRFQLLTLNKNFRKIGELAGWTDLVQKKRRKRGMLKEILKFNDGKSYRFCDLISSHTMRRTAITTLLNLGMPEHMVRKISGHAAGSKEFFKYVQYSQNYIDQEMEKAHSKLKRMNNTNSKNNI